MAWDRIIWRTIWATSTWPIRAGKQGMLQIPSPKEVHLIRPRRRAFSTVAPFLWNNIPTEISLGPTLTQLCKTRKTWFCQQAWELRVKWNPSSGSFDCVLSPEGAGLLFFILFYWVFTVSNPPWVPGSKWMAISNFQINKLTAVFPVQCLGEICWVLWLFTLMWDGNSNISCESRTVKCQHLDPGIVIKISPHFTSPGRHTRR